VRHHCCISEAIPYYWHDMQCIAVGHYAIVMKESSAIDSRSWAAIAFCVLWIEAKEQGSGDIVTSIR
jgi:hypothetical protein